MRIALFAYSSMGACVYETLLAAGHEAPVVFTHPDAAGENRWFPSVADLARARGVRVCHVDQEAGLPAAGYGRQLERVRPDALLAAGFRVLLPEPVLQAGPRGAYNVHPSLLPRYRGRSPLNWVLVNGETETGVTLHHMVAEPDAGDIVAQARIPIGPDETAPELRARLEEAAVEIVRESLPEIAAGTAPRAPQDESQRSYFGRRRPSDGQFSWTWPAERIHNLVRAVTRPYPGAFHDDGGGRPLRVWRSRIEKGGGPPLEVGQIAETAGGTLRAGTGDGVLEILQWE